MDLIIMTDKEKIQFEVGKQQLIAVWISIGIALAVNLACWYDTGMYVLHPYLTIICMIGVYGFAILVFFGKRIKKCK